MLFKTNIFAMVTCALGDSFQAEQNKIQIWNDQTRKFAGELRSRTEVKGIVLRRDIIAMVCEYAIYVYTLERLQVILHLTTNANPRGLCALATASEPWVLACPGQTTGTVRIQVGHDSCTTLEAHEKGLAAMALTAQGTLLATASEQGTVVKVFQRSDGQLLYRLRRSARPAQIACLAFRADDRFLAVSSSTATVHIFKLDLAMAESGDGEWATPDRGASGDNLAGPPTAGTMTDVVKGVMPSYFHDLRSFAQFRLPDADSDGQVALDVRSRESQIVGPQLAFHKSEHRLAILHFNGLLYECDFRPDHDPSAGTQDCSFHAATAWFAVRPDFKVHSPSAEVATVAGGADEEDEKAEEWQLL